MKRIKFFKLEASSNDFILLDNRKQNLNLDYKNFAKKYCARRIGVGADGLLIIEPSQVGIVKMRIFNPDGSEAEICGNGSRCVGLWLKLEGGYRKKKTMRVETKVGIIEIAVSFSQEIKIKMIDPFDLKLDLPVKIFKRTVKVNYVNTGVPHAVIFVEGLEGINVEKIGRAIRFHKKFSPQGTNVDFVEFGGSNLIMVRTYERGVEGETLACGTGIVASAVVASLKLGIERKVKAKTKSGEVLEVHFKNERGKFSEVWLEGGANLVYKGEITLKGG